jgi:putative copper export protein
LDETWRLIHLVAAAFWLGGLIFLAVVAVIAARTLDQPTFRRRGRTPTPSAGWGVLGANAWTGC